MPSFLIKKIPMSSPFDAPNSFSAVMLWYSITEVFLFTIRIAWGSLLKAATTHPEGALVGKEPGRNIFCFK
jgi:hypothetical protein